MLTKEKLKWFENKLMFVDEGDDSLNTTYMILNIEFGQFSSSYYVRFYSFKHKDIELACFNDSVIESLYYDKKYVCYYNGVVYSILE